MKMFLPLLALAVAHLSVTATASAQDTAIASADLTAEFLSWKASAAGQEAYASGFVPASTKETASILSDGPTAEELRRFQAAKEQVARIQKEQPLAVFSVETPFALMTTEEFAAYVSKGRVNEARRLMKDRILAQGNATAELHRQMLESVDAATAEPLVARKLESEAQQGWVVDTDWQTKGCVTRIKNQGGCGSCTMFATTAALESGYCAKTGKLYELSEQDLISCATGSGKGRCDGSWNSDNLEWITRMNDGSLCLERDYPYASGSGVAPNCRRYEDPNFRCENPKIGAKLYGGGTFEDHTELEKIVRQQPVAIDVYAGNAYFQYYKGGVLRGDETKCTGNKQDHAVLIVGFGTLDGVPYWKVKNSWSTSWGDNGWWYIERGYQGHKFGACGIETYGHYPIFPSSSDSRPDTRCEPRYGVQINGGAFLALQGVHTATHCCDSCRANPKCQGYNYLADSQICILMESVTSETLNVAGIYGASITTKSADFQLKVGSPADNVDYPGNDIMPVAAATAEDCGDKCSQTASCNAFTWSKWNNGMCYLKSAQPATLAFPTPSPDGSPFVRSGMVNKCQKSQTEVDFSGADIKSVQGDIYKCCGACRDTNKCAAYTWNLDNGGTCYLKTTGYTVKPALGTWTISATV